MPIGLSRAGVTGVQKAVRIGRGAGEKLIAATIDCTVDLDPSQKGVHMSRFPELFEEAIEGVVDDDAFLIEDLAEHVARQIVGRQGALRRRGHDHARATRTSGATPVTGLSTQEMVSLIGIAAASRERVRRVVGVEATGINACPCAQGLVRGRASERLLEAGFASGDVERILELVPLATHNQRGRGTLFVGTRERVNAERLVELVEASMSSPIYELLKRPDELFVVEHAHLQPRFVEDSVRVALGERARRAAASSTTATSSSRASSTSRRSTRTTSSPSGTGRSASSGPSCATAATGRGAHRAQGLAAELDRTQRAPERRAVLLAAQQPADVRTVQQDEHRRPRTPRRPSTGHGYPSSQAQATSEAAETDRGERR